MPAYVLLDLRTIQIYHKEKELGFQIGELDADKDALNKFHYEVGNFVYNLLKKVNLALASASNVNLIPSGMQQTHPSDKKRRKLKVRNLFKIVYGVFRAGY